jgi:hypothetical protein
MRIFRGTNLPGPAVLAALLPCLLGADEPKPPAPVPLLAATQLKDVPDDALPFVYTTGLWRKGRKSS